ncbi:hypothetical protein D3C81_1642470 [compost metagenome]
MQTPKPATAKKVIRQLLAWPNQAPSGTPSTLAMVRPLSTRAMAEARRCGGASSAASRVAQPKKPAWLKAVSMRIASSHS